MTTVEPGTATGSPWAPLRHPVFRMLWAVWMTANVCMWMNDVAAAWLMTTLDPRPVMVGLVQAAATLPVFLLSLPSGALADILDRRRYFIATQLWVALVAIILSLATLGDLLSAPLLVALTFANGIGLAMRWPVFAALVPELVPRTSLPASLALNGVAMNASRVIGPVLAGALIASLGSAHVFMLNAVLSVLVALVLVRWRYPRRESSLPGERFLGALRVGVQHVRQSPGMWALMLKVALLFFQATALLALLPLLAQQLQPGSAETYTLLMAAMGIGAVCAVVVLPRLRRHLSADRMVNGAVLCLAGSMALVAMAGSKWLAVPALVAAGSSWIVAANTLTVAAQLSLPDWVRARGMAIFQMALMGGGTFGAAAWGQMASWADLKSAIFGAAAFGVLACAATHRYTIGRPSDDDVNALRGGELPQPTIALAPGSGPVLVMVEYLIDPARNEEFITTMEESRRAWLRHGVLNWELFRDISNPNRYFEYFVDETWAEYLRRMDRVAASYATLRERKTALHTGNGAPPITRCIAQPVRRPMPRAAQM